MRAKQNLCPISSKARKIGQTVRKPGAIDLAIIGDA
jgi:hypothetical protein